MEFLDINLIGLANFVSQNCVCRSNMALVIVFWMGVWSRGTAAAPQMTVRGGREPMDEWGGR